MKAISCKIITTAAVVTLTLSGIAFIPEDACFPFTETKVWAAENGVSNNISKCKITLSKTAYVYDKKEKKPTVTVYSGSKKLVNGKDYTIKYFNNKFIGSAQVLITGKGNYSGMVFKNFKIQAAQTSELTAKSSSKIKLSWTGAKGTQGYILQKYSGGKYVTIYKGRKKSYTDTKVTKGRQYTYRIGTYKKIGKFTYYYYSSPEKAYAVNPVSLGKCSVSLSSYTRVCTGQNQQPAVTVKYKGKKLVQGKDYTLKYNNQKNPGNAYVTITGINKYTGTLKKSYKIIAFDNIKAPAASCNSTSVTLTWKKVPYADGYIVQKYDAKSRKFITAANTKSLSCTIKNLDSNTSYKFRICAYRKIGGKTYVKYSPEITKKTLPIFSVSSDRNNKNSANAAQSTINSVLELINSNRRQEGLKPLYSDDELNNAALIRAREIAVSISQKAEQELTHSDHYYADINRFPKLAVYYVLENSGFNWFKNSNQYFLGENLASGQETPQQVVTDWMNSDKHRDNILGENYNRTGIACYTYNGTTYWVQVFAT